MQLSEYETIQLYTAGTVTIPKDFPEVGEVSITLDGLALKHKKLPLVKVVRRVALGRTITYLIPLKSVMAILLVKEDEDDVDPFEVSNWLLGPELAENSEQQLLVPSADGEVRRGIVFVKRDTEVFVLTGTPMSAAQIGTVRDDVQQPRRLERPACCEERPVCRDEQAAFSLDEPMNVEMPGFSVEIACGCR